MSSHEQPVLYSVDFSGCVAMPELTPESMTDAFISTLKNAGATIMETQSHHFPGKGLTCVLILAESHAVLHTWPETGTVNLDIFSCSSRLKSLEAIVDLGKVLGASGVSVQEVLRADGHATSADGRH